MFLLGDNKSKFDLNHYLKKNEEKETNISFERILKAHQHSKLAYGQNCMKVCENIYFCSFYDFTTFFYQNITFG